MHEEAAVCHADLRPTQAQRTYSRAPSAWAHPERSSPGGRCHRASAMGSRPKPHPCRSPVSRADRCSLGQLTKPPRRDGTTSLPWGTPPSGRVKDPSRTRASASRVRQEPFTSRLRRRRYLNGHAPAMVSVAGGGERGGGVPANGHRGFRPAATVYGRQRRRHPVAAEARMLSSAPWHSGITSEEFMDAVAVVLALATFALMFGLIRAMDRI
jgi:hypothetical protein